MLQLTNTALQIPLWNCSENCSSAVSTYTPVSTDCLVILKKKRLLHRRLIKRKGKGLMSPVQSYGHGLHTAVPSSLYAMVCMYHDQGHIPINMIVIDRAVNITLGLSTIRTSVDHGTAFDIAGRNGRSREAFFKPFSLRPYYRESVSQAPMASTGKG